MDRISDKCKSMAAMAVFRDLYNQKKDIYSAIAEFVKLAIVENGLITFDLQEISNIIKENNGIELPLAVIKRSLNRLNFLHKERATYTINPDVTFEAQSILEETQRESVENQNIINQLNNFYSSRTNKKLSEEDKTTLCNEFCAFVIDDTNAPVYGEYISEFIISQSTNKDFVEQLNQIRQGVLIFVAFNYNTNYDSIDKIDNPLNIYLDTEILFHMYGLNGPIYKSLFDEFYDLVTEINKRAKKKLVRLLYFSESEDEINNYFYVAEKIVRKEERLDPSKQAMKNIVNGCADPYAVIDKKADFFQTLKEKDITLDPQDRYYDKEINYPFLINSDKFYENKDGDVTEREIDRKVNLLNYISIKRGFKSHAIFRNVGHILLSANKVTFSIAFDSSVKESNMVPLATSLSFLTNRFWISLNKSLTNISTLQSINIITKAQIALSTRINDNVGRLFQQYIKDDKEGKYNIERSKACLAELHKAVVDPKDLTAERAEDFIDILSVNDIEQYITEKSLLTARIKEESIKLKDAYDSLQRTKEQDDQKHQAALVKAAQEIMTNRNDEIKSKHQTALNKYNSQKDTAILASYNQEKQNSITTAIIYVLIVVLLYCANLFFAKNNNAGITYYIASALVGIIIFAIPFMRPLIKHDKISNAFKFCLSSQYRNSRREYFINEYVRINPEPTLKLYSLDEIITELKG